jgi:signal peptidase I
MEAGALTLRVRRGFLHRAASRTRRGIGFVASVACGVSVAVLAGLGILAALGYTVLIDRSDSMQPAIHVGDLIVTKRVGPRKVSVGDIVTFKDHTREGDLVTHRVTGMKEERGKVGFETKGDGNGATERWSVDVNGSVGAYVMRVPRAGYFVSFFTRREVRFVCVTLFGLLLGGLALRRIWKT